jgi:hypothetical protein
MGKALDKKTRKKAWILLILVLAAMLIPVRIQYKDGGTVRYRAILYRVEKAHALAVEEHRRGYHTGTRVYLLSFCVYNDVVFVPDDIHTTLSPAGGNP